MAGLKARPRTVKGRCGDCTYLRDLRRQHPHACAQLTGDPWAEDPGCYLDDDEIGVSGEAERLKVTPYSRWRKEEEAA